MLKGPRIALLIIGLLALSPLAPPHLHAQELDAACSQKFLPIKDSLNEAKARAEQILAARGKTEEHSYGANKNWTSSHEELFTVFGAPAETKLVSAEGRVFRHYVQSAEALRSIKETGLLAAGTRPYDTIATGVWKKAYVDLSGVFLTVAGKQPFEVGLANSLTGYYIDVVIDGNFPVLELEAGGVYLVPFKPNFLPWLRAEYDKFVAGELNIVDPVRKLRLERLKAMGGPASTPGVVPIKIVGEGKF